MSDDREDRIEALYQGWGARDMAERIVDLEDARDAYRASDKANRAASLKRWEWLMLTIKHRDRYRLAWTSARRRASMEANFAAEALVANEADLRRLRAFVEEVRDVRGWAMDGTGTYRTHLTPIYEALHELEEAQREGRPSRDRWTRTGHEAMADQCPAHDTIESAVPQPAPCTCGHVAATVAYWRAELERTHQEELRKSTHGA